MSTPTSFKLRRTAVLFVATVLAAAFGVSVAGTPVAGAASAGDWTVGFGGAGFDGSVVVQALPDGSVIAVAKHGFGPGGSTSVRRVLADGTTSWVRNVPEDPAGNFYGTEFSSAVLLNRSTVMFAGYSDPSGSQGGRFDAVVWSVTADGTVTQIAKWGGPGSDFAREMSVCADGSFYVGGGSWDASPSPAETAAIGMADIFVTRFGADMQRQWTRAIGSANNDHLFALRCGADDSVDLNAWAAGSVNGQGSNDYYNFFTARMDSAGATTRTIISELDHGEWSPQGGTYAPDGSYYVVGESNAGYFNAACTEWALGGSFVSHYTNDGALLWRSVLPCANLSRKIAVGASGDVFVLGTAQSRRIAGQQKFGGDDVLIHRYSVDGTRMSTRQFGSALDDVPSSFSLDGAGNVYLGGYTKGTFDGYTPVDDWDALVSRIDVADVVPTTTTVGAPQECTAGISTQLPESQTGHPVWVYGDEIGEARMTALWEYASSHAPRDFGRLIGSGQGWFGSCRYPGVGLGTGSGYSWHDRNVVLWVWSDEVDLALARRTLLDFVDSLVPVVGSTTTTAPTITTTTSTTVPGTPESTTTTIDPGVPVAGQVNLQSVAAPEPVAAGAVVKSAVSRAGVATPSVARKVTVKSRVRNAPAKDSRRATGKAPVKVSPRHHR